MTFSLPETLAAELIKTVAARERSRYVAEALQARLRNRDKALALACDEANRSEDVLAIEREFDAVPSDIVELWTDASPR